MDGSQTATTPAVTKSDEEWRRELTPEQFRVLRQQATERPGTSPLLEEHRDGVFRCAGCGAELFDSSAKYESGSGWPSFYTAREGAVATHVDRSHGMTRIEMHCARCGGHLGHIFEDGPQPTGLRFCTNGLALDFEPKE
jgi:peptide-methionine (R)-S-oxide reductase